MPGRLKLRPICSDMNDAGRKCGKNVAGNFAEVEFFSYNRLFSWTFSQASLP
jgi:hypothetical protein